MNQSDSYYYQQNNHHTSQNIPPFALSSKNYQDEYYLGIQLDVSGSPPQPKQQQVEQDNQIFFNEHMEKILDSDLNDSNFQIVSEDSQYTQNNKYSQQNHQIVPASLNSSPHVQNPTILCSRSNSPVNLPSQESNQHIHQNQHIHPQSSQVSPIQQNQQHYQIQQQINTNNDAAPISYYPSICYYQHMNDQEKMSVSMNYCRIMQLTSQVFNITKTVYSNPYITDEEMDLMLGYGTGIQHEINSLRITIEKQKILQKQSFVVPEPQVIQTTQSYYYTNEQQQQQQYIPNTCDSANIVKDGASIQTSKTKNKSSKLNNNNINNINNNPRSSPTYINLTENLIKAQNKKVKKPHSPNRVCLNCKTTDTPEWRRGPLGAKTLCNACGIRYRLSKQKTNESPSSISQEDLDSAKNSLSSSMHMYGNLSNSENNLFNHVPNYSSNQMLNNSQEFICNNTDFEPYCITSDDQSFQYSD